MLQQVVQKLNYLLNLPKHLKLILDYEKYHIAVKSEKVLARYFLVNTYACRR